MHRVQASLGLSAAVLLAVVVLIPVAAHAQAPGQPLLEANVTKAELVLKIYDDGAVQPIYTLKALIRPLQPLGQTVTQTVAGGEGGSVDVKYTSRLERDRAYTSLSLKGSLKGGESEEPLNVYLKFEAGLVEGNGTFTFILRGYEANETFNITLPRARVWTVDSTVWISGYLYLSPVTSEEASGELASPSEINAALSQEGLDYLRVISLNKTMVGPSTLRLGFTVSIDLQRLARHLAAQMEPEKAKRLESLLTHPQQLRRVNVTLTMSAWTVENLLEFEVEYRSSAEGNITAYQAYTRELGKLLSEVQAGQQQLPGLPVGTATPKELMLLVALQKLLQNPASQSLVEVPPSESRLELHMSISDYGVSIEASYTGHRLAVPGVTDPEERAEKTLTALSLAISYYRQSLAMLSQFVKGIEKLVPERARLQPVGTVKVSKTVASIDELAAVKVQVQHARTTTAGTAKPSPTGTATPTETGGTTTTPQPTATAAPTTPSGAGGAATTKAGAAGEKQVSTATIALAVSAGMLVAAVALLVFVIRRR